MAVIKPRRKLVSQADPVVGRPAVGATPGGEVGGRAATDVPSPGVGVGVAVSVGVGVGV
jgi:hypothetical protein